MRTTLIVAIATLIGAFSSPIGAATNNLGITETREQRFARVMEAVRTAPFVQYGKKLAPLVKGAVKAMPKEDQRSLDDVIVVNDLPAFVHLFGLPSSEESDMLKFLSAKDAFAFVGNSPIFINGTNPTYKAFEAAFASGDSKPVRLLRAKLSHESRHSAGEKRELPCYDYEIGLLDADYRTGSLAGAESYIQQIKGYQKYLVTLEPTLSASR
jgi:hypothetical protein